METFTGIFKLLMQKSKPYKKMKQLLFILALFASLFVNAQRSLYDDPLDTSSAPKIDSSTVEVSITLNAEQHFLIIDFLQDIKTPRNADYIKQVVRQLDTVFNPSQLITVATESSIVPEIYNLLSVQREGVTAQPNRDMKAALIPQLQGYTWIAEQIHAIDERNLQLRQAHVDRGFQYAKSLKY
ncbi:MAG: hypothetical protein EOO01_04615 [Chitinophagaceae bacterium]|nr:MAG: hypothetical protein EOO01_04615 [Chitinophagaceae bacterium]